MAIYKKQEIIKSFPAFNVVRREANSNLGGPEAINVTANEVMTDEEMLYGWCFGSAVSYALENNEDPIESFNNCNGPTHWLNTECSVLSSSYVEIEDRILIKEGDVVLFEGVYFKVKSAPNNNKQLVRV